MTTRYFMTSGTMDNQITYVCSISIKSTQFGSTCVYIKVLSISAAIQLSLVIVIVIEKKMNQNQNER